jgi:hypothetical protein
VDAQRVDNSKDVELKEGQEIRSLSLSPSPCVCVCVCVCVTACRFGVKDLGRYRLTRRPVRVCVSGMNSSQKSSTAEMAAAAGTVSLCM